MGHTVFEFTAQRKFIPQDDGFSFDQRTRDAIISNAAAVLSSDNKEVDEEYRVCYRVWAQGNPYRTLYVYWISTERTNIFCCQITRQCFRELQANCNIWNNKMYDQSVFCVHAKHFVHKYLWMLRGYTYWLNLTRTIALLHYIKRRLPSGQLVSFQLESWMSLKPTGWHMKALDYTPY